MVGRIIVGLYSRVGSSAIMAASHTHPITAGQVSGVDWAQWTANIVGVLAVILTALRFSLKRFDIVVSNMIDSKVTPRFDAIDAKLNSHDTRIAYLEGVAQGHSEARTISEGIDQNRRQDNQNARNT
jgi:hypothetical protein